MESGVIAAAIEAFIKKRSRRQTRDATDEIL
jgi:hypothetical protein